MESSGQVLPQPTEAPVQTGDAMDLDTPSPTLPSIDAPPKAGQQIRYNDQLFTTIREGRAHILAPLTTSENARAEARGRTEPRTGNRPSCRDDAADDTSTDSATQAVFYNPIQQFNRDLSVLAIRAFGEDLLARRECVAKKVREQREKSLSNRKMRKKRKTDEGSAVEDGSQNGDAETVPSEVVPTEPTAETEGPTSPKPLPPLAFTILDALSATGLRAMRYALELPFHTQIVGNDLSPTATDLIRLNSQHNQVADRVSTITGNAMSTMYSRLEAPEPLFAVDPLAQSASGAAPKPTKFDIIDLDPYGTAAIFIDSAVQAVSDGGMVCVTCTDSSVFASAGYPEKTFSLYGGLPTKGPYSHESALRLIIQSVATSAARHGMSVEPLLSLSIDYYVRIFIRVRRSPAEVKFLAGKSMLVYACDAGCGAWQTQLLGRNTAVAGKKGTTYYKHTAAQGPSQDGHCSHCGFKTHIAGPMWAGPLHNGDFIDRILSLIDKVDHDRVDGEKVYGTLPRLEGMLLNAKEELTLIDFSESVPQPKRAKDESKRGNKRPITEMEMSDNASAPAATEESTAPAPSPAAPASPVIASGTSSSPSPSTSTAPTTSPALFSRVPIPTIDHHPFYVFPSQLARILHAQSPSENAFRGALRHAGFRATRSHTKPGAIKTDAPWGAIWHIMREWVRQHAPVKETKLGPGTAGWTVIRGGADACRRLAFAASVRDRVAEAMAGVNGAQQDGGPVVAEPEASGSEPQHESAPSAPEIHTKMDQAKGQTVHTISEAEIHRYAGPAPPPEFKFEVVFDDKLGADKDKSNGKSKGKKSQSEAIGGGTGASGDGEKEGSGGQPSGSNGTGAGVDEKRKVVRYQLNPEPNWGPMRRAKAK